MQLCRLPSLSSSLVRALCLAATLVLPSPSRSAVDLGGVLVQPGQLIIFLFIGHSNMEGYGGVMDTVVDPRAWVFTSAGGFRPARDPVASSRKSPSPVMPFLKEMVRRYPDYYFCAIKVTQAGRPMRDTFLPGKPQYLVVAKEVRAAMAHGTLGGILAMFGFVEGISDSLSSLFLDDASALVVHLRVEFAATSLPFVFGRYEENASRTKYLDYYKYADQVKEAILALPERDVTGHLVLAPDSAVPGEMYFDDHHYSEVGYAYWSGCAARAISERGWDFWFDSRLDTLPPSPPDSLYAAAAVGRSLVLGWTRATDNLRVAGYRVYLGDSLAGETQTAYDTLYTLDLLAPDTVNTFTVVAVDGAGNLSPRSPGFAVTAGVDTIVAPLGSLRVVEPNGGEIVALAGDLAVTWTSTMAPESLVVVEVSSDSGEHWRRLGGATVAAGVGSLAAPFVLGAGESPGGTWLARVCTPQGSVTDVSDGVWSAVQLPDSVSGAESCVADFDVSLARRSDTSLTVRWRSDLCTRCFVALDGVPVAGQFVYRTGGDAAVVTVAGLSANTNYGVSVHSVDQDKLGSVGCAAHPVRTGGGGASSAPLSVEYPEGGETFNTGDTIVIEWTYDALRLNTVVIHATADSGRSWHLATTSGASAAEDQFFVWPLATAPSEIVGERVRLRIADYGNVYAAYSGDFTIEPNSVVTPWPKASGVGWELRLQNRTIVVRAPPDSQSRGVRLEVTGLDGRLVYRAQAPAGQHILSVRLAGSGAGIYLVRITAGGRTRVVTAVVPR